MTGSVGWSRGASARCTAFLSVSERVDREVVGAVVEVETALARLGTFRICTCSASSTQSQPRSRQMFDLVRCDEVHSAACKHRAHIPPPSRATGQRTHDILPSDDTPTLLAAAAQQGSLQSSRISTATRFTKTIGAIGGDPTAMEPPDWTLGVLS